MEVELEIVDQRMLRLIYLHDPRDSRSAMGKGDDYGTERVRGVPQGVLDYTPRANLLSSIRGVCLVLR